MPARISCTLTLRLGRHLSEWRPDCSLVTVNSAGSFTGHESPSMAQRSEQTSPAPPGQTQLGEAETREKDREKAEKGREGETETQVANE